MRRQTAASIKTLAVNITPKTVKISDPNDCISGVFQKNKSINPMKKIELVILPMNEGIIYLN